ncbi:flagellar protein FlaG [Massilia yuzhufengensis]|uniref:Flagellar protein FlaG n=1 Tax=Massilia yuzhufengensis TaxID=1164594 RepID=A0A1I1MM40_9BURK|nr:flagellar protein FlaG [Massilia yuzhufengensis]SFC86451.1 flagellar protein FlaG [Massilia yuzhufengensis]
MQLQPQGITTTGADPIVLPRTQSPAPASTPAATSAKPVDGAKQADAAGKPASPADVDKALDSINKTMKSLSHSLEFSLDDDSKRQVVKVIDPETREVIRQMPSKEALEIAKALDRLQGLLIRQQA